MQILDDGYGECRGQPEEEPCTQAEDGGTQGTGGLPPQPQHQQRNHGADHHRSCHQGSRRCVVHSSVRIPHEHEHREPDHDGSGADELPTHDMLAGQPRRCQREAHRRDESQERCHLGERVIAPPRCMLSR
jgi:hypothetical protein